MQLKKEASNEKNKINMLEQEINSLKQSIHRWQTDNFEKERVAREELQMSLPNEFVYVLPKNFS